MQDQVIRQTGEVFAKLNPAIRPNDARTIHGRLKVAGAGVTVFYDKGQVLRQKDDGSAEFAINGTGGYTGPVRAMVRPVTIDENGYWQYGSTFYANVGAANSPASFDMYYQGFFYCQELIGLHGTGLGGTNEVQLETITATGGSRTLKFTDPVTGVPYTTAAMAFDLNAAGIQAILDALLGTNAVVVGTSSANRTYTFSGNRFAGLDVPAIVVDGALLTGGTSVISTTTPGVTLSAKVGKIISGNASQGIIALGEGTPA